jgi:hypothetical protein
MRRCEPTGVQVESAIEYGEACVTCGGFAAEQDDPCGDCVARPERRDALRWALETCLHLGQDPRRLELARKTPAVEGEEGEWRCDALRALTNEHEANRLVHRLVHIGWSDRPHLSDGLGIYLDRLPTEDELSGALSYWPGYAPTALWPRRDGRGDAPSDRLPDLFHTGFNGAPTPILLSLSNIPHFVRMLLAILEGPEAAASAFESACREAWSDFGAQRVRWKRTGEGKWEWELHIGDASIPAMLGPIRAVRHATELAAKMMPWPPTCAGCMGPVKEGVEWCRTCLPILWAGELTRHFGTPRKAIKAVVERKAKPNTSLPEPFPPAVVNTIDRIVFDDEWLRAQLCVALAARGWCGSTKGDPSRVDQLVRANRESFVLRVMLDLDRHEQPGIIGLTKKQARRLLPIVTAIPWFLPDVRERVSSAIELLVSDNRNGCGGQ